MSKSTVTMWKTHGVSWENALQMMGYEEYCMTELYWDYHEWIVAAIIS